MLEPVIATNDDLSKLFFECKDYVVAICQGGALSDKLDDLCQVLTISCAQVSKTCIHTWGNLKIIKS